MNVERKLFGGFFFFFFLCPVLVEGQNLVRNPGFEIVLNPSCNLTSDSAGFRSMVQDWQLATEGTADLRTTLVGQNCLTHCTSSHPNVHGRQAPYEGNAMVGLYTYSYSGGGNYREYVTIELTSAMEVNETYYCEMYVSRAENFALSSNNIGMYFSDNPIYEQSIDYINVTPQINYSQVITDTSGWVRVSGEITPTSPLKYVAIGNFFSNANTTTETIADPAGKSFSAYYFIDVVLIRKGRARTQIDTTICEGDSIELSAGNDIALAWSLLGKPDSIISTDQSIWVAPKTKQTYVFYGQKDTIEYNIQLKAKTPELELGIDTLNLCAGQTKDINVAIQNVDFLWQDGSIDSVYTIYETGQYWLQISNSCGSNRDTLVVVDDECDCYVYVPNVFTPNTDSLNELFAPETDCEPDEYLLQIYNRWGELLFESYDLSNKWDGSYLGRLVPEGVYFWILSMSESKSGISKRTPLSGTVTLLR